MPACGGVKRLLQQSLAKKETLSTYNQVPPQVSTGEPPTRKLMSFFNMLSAPEFLTRACSPLVVTIDWKKPVANPITAIVMSNSSMIAIAGVIPTQRMQNVLQYAYTWLWRVKNK